MFSFLPAFVFAQCLALVESQSFGNLPSNNYGLQENATYDYVVSIFHMTATAGLTIIAVGCWWRYGRACRRVPPRRRWDEERSSGGSWRFLRKRCWKYFGRAGILHSLRRHRGERGQSVPSCGLGLCDATRARSRWAEVALWAWKDLGRKVSRLSSCASRALLTTRQLGPECDDLQPRNHRLISRMGRIGGR